MQFEFGSGAMYGTKINDNGTYGASRVFGILQAGSCDFAATNKQLFGTYQFPVAVGRGTAKITGKATFAQIQANMYNDLFFRGTVATGQTVLAIDEKVTVASGPIATVANAATWATDIIVRDALGLQMTRVVSAPALHEYTVAAGVYTPFATDTDFAVGDVVTITYEYTLTPGLTLTIANTLLGTAPSFKLRLQQTFLGKTLLLTLNQVISSKLTFATKLEDFQIPEMDFDAFADNNNEIGHLYSVE